MTVAAYIQKLNESTDFWSFSVTQGKKYTKIVQVQRSNQSGRSVHAFVDAQGNVYKPASWAAPAKGVRFNLASLDTQAVDPYGSYLYAR